MPDPITSDILKSLESNYLEKDYDKGIEIMLEAKNLFQSNLFHYNLGTLHLKKNEFAIGRFHLEKAFHLGMVNNGLLNNLKTAKTKLRHDGIIEPNGFIHNFYFTAMSVPSSVYLGLTLIIVLFSIWLMKLKKIRLITKLALCIISFLPFAFSQFIVKEHNFAIALKPLIAREGPSEIFDLAYEIPKGTKLILKKPVEGWFFIVSPLDATGWVKKENLGLY